MILGPVSLLDCLVFCIFLTPQLLFNVGFFPTVLVVLKALPFLVFELPTSLLRERWLLSWEERSPFVQRATFFEDLVIRCVRYAFANLPTNIGRVFFSKYISLPFLRFRMLRHGYIRSPVSWREYKQHGRHGFQGIWINADASKPPDVVVYYAHGGGFAMGSAHFYLEFLLSWHALLVQSGYRNPAIFALDYTLVPDEMYPTQVYETLRGYKHVLSVAGDSRKVVIAGDSAGATLMLTLLLELGHMNEARAFKEKNDDSAPSEGESQQSLRQASESPLPGLCVLISPWAKLISNKHENTASDYLDRDTLWKYALQYAGCSHAYDQTASPGQCADHRVWAEASPPCGFFITYGSEEVFAPDIKDLINVLVKGAEVDSRSEDGGIHAWPVVSLFLSDIEDKRLKGLRTLTSAIRKHIL
ncbi:arylacetamide deacetylase [Colletotrichum truncatum]|uniref:Arylacetamide deacetylase n=1 Tax=Colletotrichum truncatum TaxID=5467 RepID=A0ACC3YGF7_COLTU|nr:arylacetamide deacetylase [Colletotrichum truncatum]KAF6785460.1 arylacetamide deacetylase [Colletotrichum truncatum]